MDPVLTDINKIKRRDKSFLVYHYLIKSLSEAIEKYATGNVLDIGCGNKPYRHLFKNIDSYTGCDKYQNDSNTVDILCNATAIPLEDDAFETIICTQVIEHIADNKLLLKEAHRLLRKHGILILSGPLYWPVHGEPNDYFRFTKYGFVHLLEECGFSITEIKENGGAWATAGQAFAHGLEFSSRRSVFFRAFRFIYLNLRFISISNSFFLWMDKRDFNPNNPINYVVVATKKQ